MITRIKSFLGLKSMRDYPDEFDFNEYIKQLEAIRKEDLERQRQETTEKW
jgi:hypothetical protein